MEIVGFSHKVSLLPHLTNILALYVSDQSQSVMRENPLASSDGDVESGSLKTGFSPVISSLSLVSPGPSSSGSKATASTPSRAIPVTPISLKFASEDSAHQNPNWLSDLKKNFYSEIIQPCSVKTKEAAENDEYIQVCPVLF